MKKYNEKDKKSKSRPVHEAPSLAEQFPGRLSLFLCHPMQAVLTQSNNKSEN